RSRSGADGRALTFRPATGWVNSRARLVHGAQALAWAAEPRLQRRLRLGHSEPAVERSRRLLVERGGGDGGELGDVEAELAADALGGVVAVHPPGPSDVAEATGVGPRQLHAGRPHLGGVGRTRLLIHGQAEAFPLPGGAQELVDEVLLLALGAVHHAGAHDDGAAAGRQHRLLALVLAPAVHAEGTRRIVLAERAALAVEDVFRRVVDEAR